MPDPIYYHSDMSTEKKAEFERWYSEKVLTNCNFIMQQEAYCESDIKPLKGGCPMFGDEFKKWRSASPSLPPAIDSGARNWSPQTRYLPNLFKAGMGRGPISPSKLWKCGLARTPPKYSTSCSKRSHLHCPKQRQSTCSQPSGRRFGSPQSHHSTSHHVQNFTDVYGTGASTAFPSTADFPSAIMTVLYKKSTNHPQETRYPEMAGLRLVNPVRVCLGPRGESRSLAVPWHAGNRWAAPTQKHLWRTQERRQIASCDRREPRRKGQIHWWRHCIPVPTRRAHTPSNTQKSSWLKWTFYLLKDCTIPSCTTDTRANSCSHSTNHVWKRW